MGGGGDVLGFLRKKLGSVLVQRVYAWVWFPSMEEVAP
jgi:hypothetical protein